MKKFRKFIIYLLSLALGLSLGACGEKSPEAGKYICRAFRDCGELSPVSEAEAAVIVLSNGGGGLFAFRGDKGEISWSLRGEKLSLYIGKEERQAGIKDGCIVLHLEDNTEALFYKSDAELPSELAAVGLPESFYGWWRISSSGGEMPETWIDCCAAFDALSCSLKIWDEDGNAENPMGEIELYSVPAEDAETEQGDDTVRCFAGRRGYFWYTESSEAEWIMKENGRGAYTVSGSAMNKNGGEFSYEIYLRKWGDKWQYEQENEPELLPYHYTDWYMPLIDAGEEMPSEIAD